MENHSISEKLRLTELRTSSLPCRGKESLWGGDGSPIKYRVTVLSDSTPIKKFKTLTFFHFNDYQSIKRLTTNKTL